MVKGSFSEIQRIEIENRVNIVGANDFNTNVTKRLHPLIYMLIVNKYATLKEIKEDYDVYDILDLYEVCAVNLYNKHEIQKERRSNKK